MTARKTRGTQKKQGLSCESREGSWEQLCHGKAPGQSSKAQGNPPARAEQSAAATGKGFPELFRAPESRGAWGKLETALAAENPPKSTPLYPGGAGVMPREDFSVLTP